MMERWQALGGTVGFPPVATVAGAVVLLLCFAAWLIVRRLRARRLHSESATTKGGSRRTDWAWCYVGGSAERTC